MKTFQVEVGKKCLSMLACHKLSNPEANFLSGFTNSTKYFIMGTTKTWHEKRGSMHAYNDSYISNVIFHNYWKILNDFDILLLIRLLAGYFLAMNSFRSDNLFNVQILLSYGLGNDGLLKCSNNTYQSTGKTNHIDRCFLF